MSSSLQPHRLQHVRLPCPSLSPGVCSNSCPLIQWCHLILCCPLLLLPSIFPSIRDFLNELTLHINWPKYWSFSFSISPSNEYSGLISFRIDWFDLLTIQGTLKNLQHFSKAPPSNIIVFGGKDSNLKIWKGCKPGDHSIPFLLHSRSNLDCLLRPHPASPSSTPFGHKELDTAEWLNNNSIAIHAGISPCMFNLDLVSASCKAQTHTGSFPPSQEKAWVHHKAGAEQGLSCSGHSSHICWMSEWRSESVRATYSALVWRWVFIHCANDSLLASLSSGPLPSSSKETRVLLSRSWWVLILPWGSWWLQVSETLRTQQPSFLSSVFLRHQAMSIFFHPLRPRKRAPSRGQHRQAR